MPTLTAPATPAPVVGELTGRQVVIQNSPFPLLGGQSAVDPMRNYATYRQMRTDPTIALARALSTAPILAAQWTVEADDGVVDEVSAFVQEQFMPLREQFLEAALFGGIDFGHAGFEKVFDVRDGRLVLRKLKPLIPDETDILIQENGTFNGFKQGNVIVPVANALLISFRVEGTDWYGQPLMENARRPWEWWNEANDGAARYDKNIAGSHWVVKFPIGETPDKDGNNQENVDLADQLLTSLRASGSIAIPQCVKDDIESLNAANPGWDVQLIGDSGGRQPSFLERLRYLDTLKARALILPERAILEGQYGTKAEAEAQGDTALTMADLHHKHVVQLLNWHAVDQLVALNFGESYRGTVRIVASPLVDAAVAYLRTVYTALLANPSGFLSEFPQLDTDAMKDALGVPKARIVAQAGGSDGTVDEPEDEPPAGPEAQPGAQDAKQTPGAPGTAGLDPNTPIAATVRRLYRSLDTLRKSATQ